MGANVTFHRATVRAGLLEHAVAIFLAVLTIIQTSPSCAGDPPDAIVKTKSIEARIFLDDRIKADAALAADCLAEGRKWLNKNAAESAASRKADPTPTSRSDHGLSSDTLLTTLW